MFVKNRSVSAVGIDTPPVVFRALISDLSVHTFFRRIFLWPADCQPLWASKVCHMTSCSRNWWGGCSISTGTRKQDYFLTTAHTPQIANWSMKGSCGAKKVRLPSQSPAIIVLRSVHQVKRLIGGCSCCNFVRKQRMAP